MGSNFSELLATWHKVRSLCSISSQSYSGCVDHVSTVLTTAFGKARRKREVMEVPQPAVAPGPAQEARVADRRPRKACRSCCSLMCCHFCGTCTDWRWAGYSALSTLAALVVAHHAYITREQFYPALIYLLSNKISVAVRI